MHPSYLPYFLSLTLSNVRCFAEPQTLRLTRPDGRPARFTFLLGENGTGKTTVLQMLAHLRPSDEALHPIEGPAVLNLAPELVRWEPRTTEGDVNAWRGELTVGFATGIDAPTAREVTLFNEGTSSSEDAFHEFFDGPSPCVALVVAYGPLRRSGSAQLTDDAPQDAVGTLFSDNARLIHAEEWYLQRDYAANNPRNSKRDRARAANARDRVASLLTKVLPDVTAVEPVTADPVKGVTHLMARTPYGMRRIAELGFGYQTTLAWVVDLAARMTAAYPESDDPLGEPAVVLLDEIDLHLHPRWQRTLLAELAARFPNVQFVATSHSPLIVQAAPDANVAVLRREGDRVVIDQTLPSVHHWRVDQILTSDLFGLPSARDPSLDVPIARRDVLLAKPALDADDERELARLRAQIGEAPGGETPWEMRAMEVIRQAARALEGGGVRDVVRGPSGAPPKKKGAGSAARRKPTAAKGTRRS